MKIKHPAQPHATASEPDEGSPDYVSDDAFVRGVARQAVHAFRPWLELQLAIALLRDPAASRGIRPERMADKNVAALVRLLRENPQRSQNVHAVALAKAAHCDEGFVDFVRWVSRAPKVIHGRMPSVSWLRTTLLSIPFLDQQLKGDGRRKTRAWERHLSEYAA